MKTQFSKTLTTLSLVTGASLFSACGESGTNNSGVVEEADGIVAYTGKVTGVSQKGPFLVGSTITLHEVDDETFNLSGRSFPDKIKNDKGEFEISYKDLSSNFALLIADGYYRNENTGVKSTAPIKLNALSDLTDRNTANVNLLTHLEFDRVKHLILEEEMEYSEAKAKAEKEILRAFGMDLKKPSSAEDLSIFGKSENDGALLALSILMQGVASEGAFSERLALIAQDLEKDGIIDDKQILTDIADEAVQLDLSEIKKNILDWKISTDIPKFESFVATYWAENFGIGNCTSENIGKTANVKNELSKNFEKTFVCDEIETDKVAMWREISSDEKKYGLCSAANEGNRFEDILICHDGTWKDMLPEEKVGECTEDLYGEIVSYDNAASAYKGEQYACDIGGWRLLSEEEVETGACTAAPADQGKLYANSEQNVYQICREGKWNLLTKNEYQKISATISCKKDGDIVKSESGDQYFVCKDGAVVTPSLNDFSMDKKFEANLWNGAKDSVVTLNPDDPLGYSSILMLDQDNNASSAKVYHEDGEEITSQYFVRYNSDGIAEELLEAKGAKFTYKLDENHPYSQIRFGFWTAPKSSQDLTADISDWEGVCVIYASTSVMNLFIETGADNNYTFNFAKLPASMELTVANFKWEELNENTEYKIDPLEAAKNSASIAISPSINTFNGNNSAATGAVYIAGIGKYNGCSIK